MTTMTNNQLRADEYRGRAADATASADSATLDNVRDRHVAAAARWTDLARLNERHAGQRTAETKRSLILTAIPRGDPCTA